MGGQAFDTLGHLAGYGVGALSALTSIRGGGLQNWLLNRQRAVEDPGIRASLVGSPFASGMLFQGGGDVAAPGTMPAAGGVAAPEDIRWLQQQAPERRFVPSLPPLPAEAQVGVQAAQGIISGAQSADPAIRAQAKLAGKIPLTLEETNAAVGRGIGIQAGLGPGGTVGIEAPGMPITIGSPYSVSPGVAPDEYASPEEAWAAARNRGSDWTVQQTNRGTWKPVQVTPPMTPAAPTPYNPNAPAGAPGQQPAAPVPYNPNAPAPGSVPRARPPLASAVAPPLFAGAVTTTGGPPPTVPERHNNPGDIKDGAFARSQPGYVGPGEAAQDGGRFARFDSPDSGQAAMGNLLRGKNYGGLTLGDAASKWSGGGYGADWVAKQGFDPSRTVNSLSDDEMGTFTGAMARREGFRGPLGVAPPPAPAAALAPPPAPPSRPAAPPPRPVAPTGTPGLRAGQPQLALAPPPAPYMGGPYDPNAPAPGAVPARIGYPSPAFGGEVAVPPPGTVAGAPVPEMAPPGPVAVPTPPTPTVTAPTQQAPVQVEPTSGGNLPLTHVTVRGANGQEYSYDLGAPGEFAADMRRAGITSLETASPQQIEKLNQFVLERQKLKEATSADVQRITRPASPGEAGATQNMMDMRNALDTFFADFPNPADRDKYVGWYKRPISEWLAYARVDPNFELFVKDMAPFQNFDAQKGALNGYERNDFSTMPNGHEMHAEQFEQKLFDFDLSLSHDLGLRLDLQRMPVGQQTSDWVNQQRVEFQKQRAALRTNAALQAMGLAPQNAAPQAAAPVPDVAPAPATPPPAVRSANAPGPIVFYGHSPAGY